MHKIFTFGLKVTYKGENRLEVLKQFIEQNSITTVIDVRYSTGNQYERWNCNGFHIERMIEKDFKDKCRYIHAPRLGIQWKVRQAYKDDPKGMEFWYLNYLREEDLLVMFETFINPERVLLLCVENIKDPQTPHCHRFWLQNCLVAEDLAELGEELVDKVVPTVSFTIAELELLEDLVNDAAEFNKMKWYYQLRKKLRAALGWKD